MGKVKGIGVAVAAVAAMQSATAGLWDSGQFRNEYEMARNVWGTYWGLTTISPIALTFRGAEKCFITDSGLMEGAKKALTDARSEPGAPVLHTDQPISEMARLMITATLTGMTGSQCHFDVDAELERDAFIEVGGDRIKVKAVVHRAGNSLTIDTSKPSSDYARNLGEHYAKVMINRIKLAREALDKVPADQRPGKGKK